MPDVPWPLGPGPSSEGWVGARAILRVLYVYGRVRVFLFVFVCVRVSICVCVFLFAFVLECVM